MSNVAIGSISIGSSRNLFDNARIFVKNQHMKEILDALDQYS